MTKYSIKQSHRRAYEVIIKGLQGDRALVFDPKEQVFIEVAREALSKYQKECEVDSEQLYQRVQQLESFFTDKQIQEIHKAFQQRQAKSVSLSDAKEQQLMQKKYRKALDAFPEISEKAKEYAPGAPSIRQIAKRAGQIVQKQEVKLSQLKLHLSRFKMVLKEFQKIVTELTWSHREQREVIAVLKKKGVVEKRGGGIKVLYTSKKGVKLSRHQEGVIIDTVEHYLESLSDYSNVFEEKMISVVKELSTLIQFIVRDHHETLRLVPSESSRSFKGVLRARELLVKEATPGIKREGLMKLAGGGSSLMEEWESAREGVKKRERRLHQLRRAWREIEAYGEGGEESSHSPYLKKGSSTVAKRVKDNPALFWSKYR